MGRGWLMRSAIEVKGEEKKAEAVPAAPTVDESMKHINDRMNWLRKNGGFTLDYSIQPLAQAATKFTDEIKAVLPDSVPLQSALANLNTGFKNLVEDWKQGHPVNQEDFDRGFDQFNQFLNAEIAGQAKKIEDKQTEIAALGGGDPAALAAAETELKSLQEHETKLQELPDKCQEFKAGAMKDELAHLKSDVDKQWENKHYEVLESKLDIKPKWYLVNEQGELGPMGEGLAASSGRITVPGMYQQFENGKPTKKQIVVEADGKAYPHPPVKKGVFSDFKEKWTDLFNALASAGNDHVKLSWNGEKPDIDQLKFAIKLAEERGMTVSIDADLQKKLGSDFNKINALVDAANQKVAREAAPAVNPNETPLERQQRHVDADIAAVAAASEAASNLVVADIIPIPDGVKAALDQIEVALNNVEKIQAHVDEVLSDAEQCVDRAALPENYVDRFDADEGSFDKSKDAIKNGLVSYQSKIDELSKPENAGALTPQVSQQLTDLQGKLTSAQDKLDRASSKFENVKTEFVEIKHERNAMRAGRGA